jgi:outer membrane protein assembly factor BamA
VLAFAGRASAQQSASPPPDARPADPQPTTPPSEPTFVEKARERADDTKIVERLAGTTDGWYPRLGGIRRGSGLAGGPGYRTHVGHNVLVDLSGSISIRNYKAVDARVRWLQTPRHRAELWTDYAFDDFRQERFFGLGAETLERDRTTYGFRNNTIAVRGILRPISRLEISAHVGLMRPRLDAGSNNDYRHTSETFTDLQAPGLAIQPPSFFQSEVAADVDWRDAPGNPARGGLYRVSFGRWSDRDQGRFDFRRFDGEATQYVPLTVNKQHVLSGRVGFAAATADAGARVPFYFLPYIGGSDTVRSYMEYRFAGEDALWYSAEYHWNPVPYVSLATFVDAARIARTWSGLGSAETKTGYGFGVIAHTSKQMLARIDLGFGGEGWHLWLNFGAF